MASENAKAVAKEVSENIGLGKKVAIGPIMRKHGYSEKTSKTPKRVTNTKTFKKEMAPVVSNMIKTRDKAVLLMNSRLSKAKLRDLTDLVDKLTKNIQLLTGKDTSKEAVTFTWKS